MNPTLKALYDADRLDHAVPMVAGTDEYKELRIRDKKRREQVQKTLDESSVKSHEDLYHAAWIMNHGEDPADAELAFTLAKKAIGLGSVPSRWLFAAAYDRWCMYSGKPQKFGTQIIPDGQRYRVWDTDPDTTDQERTEFDVPPIAELLQRAERDSKTIPQPPMELAPSWLKEAIERWADQ